MTASAPQQPLVALNRANESRVRRRHLKQQLRVGEVSIDTVLAQMPWWLATVPTFELLGWVPQLGVRRRDAALSRAKVWPLARVGELSDGQRVALCEALRVAGRDVAAVRRGRLWCGGCGERLRHVALSGLCGFCEEEAA